MAASTGRLPLMAGNWKMNLNHLEAIAVVQKLAFALTEADLAACEVATPEDAQEVCAAIRTRLAELYSGDLADGVRILYGGSVKASNVAAIMAKSDVDGALVGGASLDPDEFIAICRFRLHPADAS